MSVRIYSLPLRAATALALLGIVGGQSAASAETPAQQEAYDVAITCYVANTNAEGERQDVGDGTGASGYEAQAKRSFDIAVKIGRDMGRTGERITTDIERVSARELPRMVKDRGYFSVAVANCRAAGLMR